LQNVAIAGDEDMLTPYAEFDPETGFFLSPEEMSVDNSHPQTVPAAPPIADKSQSPAQETETNSNAMSFNPLLIISTLVIFAIVVAVGIRKLIQKPE
jgi:hypothetical protein